MASTNLTRTPSSAGDLNTWTLSVWCKRAKTDSSTSSYTILSGDQSGSYGDMIRFREDKLNFYNRSNSTNNYFSDRLYRDTSAWYHIVIQYDGANSTINAYVNGEDAGNVSISLNEDSSINNNTVQVIGAGQSVLPAYIYDGLMAHFHFIDGTIYDADTFGETETSSGIWKPKLSPSVTYGTNGFFLKFQDSSALGDDSSGNTNDFTVNGTGTQTLDTPSNVFATMSPVINMLNGTPSYSNGNTTIAGSGTAWMRTTCGMGVRKGKWYYEAKLTTYYGAGRPVRFGWDSIDFPNDGSDTYYSGFNISSDGFIRGGIKGYVGYDPNSTALGTTLAAGDILGMAIDLDNDLVSCYKNGTIISNVNELDISGNSNCSIISSKGYQVAPSLVFYAVSESDNKVDFNFGNGYFGTTAVASANSDTAGLGQFEYSVPSGYYALCTKNIAEYG